MNHKVYIILLNYNSADDTIQCVKSIQENETKIEYEIIVVDNQSQDDSVKKLKELRNITFIQAKENGGFAAGNNIGIQYALENGADYVLLLNNDTTIEKDAIYILLKKLEENPQLGIVGSRIMYYHQRDKINYYGGKIDWLKAISIHENYQLPYQKQKEEFFYTDFITGCCMLIKSEVFEQVGYLPEEYFMYYEDVDFCIQVSQRGYKLGVCTNSVIYHKVSASSGGEESPFSIEWGTRNRMIFIKKYKQYTKGILTNMFFYLTRILKIIVYRFKGEQQKARAILKGMKHGRQYIKEHRIEKNK